jgi:hypothetical protein
LGNLLFAQSYPQRLQCHGFLHGFSTVEFHPHAWNAEVSLSAVSATRKLPQRLSVDITKARCQLKRPRPVKAHEDIGSLHERNIAFECSRRNGRNSARSFHDFDDEVFEWLELAIVSGTGFDGLRDNAENTHGFEGNEECESFDGGVRRVRMRHEGEGSKRVLAFPKKLLWETPTLHSHD